MLALAIDCHTRELLGCHLSRRGKATTASSALEHALIARFGTLGRVPEPFLRRSDNGFVFTSRNYTALVHSYGLQQEFITPHCPQQNGIVERVIRTLHEQCAHRHRFETLQHASRVIGTGYAFTSTGSNFCISRLIEQKQLGHYTVSASSEYKCIAKSANATSN